MQKYLYNIRLIHIKQSAIKRKKNRLSNPATANALRVPVNPRNFELDQGHRLHTC